MSRTDPAPAEYTLHVDSRGVLVIVRGAASVELFERVMAEIVAHPGFRLDMPSIWDMRESEGFGSMTREELGRMLMVSRHHRRDSEGYRVAMVAGRRVDFGVGRMMEGGLERHEAMELGVFDDLEEAQAWAFGPATDVP